MTETQNNFVEFVCADLPPIPNPLELIMPGGITIERVNLMEVLHALLAPLMPIFKIIDIIAAIINCLQAVPQILTDPMAIGECLQELAEKLGQILRMLPQLSIPYLIIGLIDILIDMLKTVRRELRYLQQQMEQIARVIDRASELNDHNLNSIGVCAQSNVQQEAMNTLQMLASLGRLIGIINMFSKMVGGPEIPDFSDLAGTPLDLIIEPLDLIVEVLETARAAVPLP